MCAFAFCLAYADRGSSLHNGIKLSLSPSKQPASLQWMLRMRISSILLGGKPNANEMAEASHGLRGHCVTLSADDVDTAKPAATPADPIQCYRWQFQIAKHHSQLISNVVRVIYA